MSWTIKNDYQSVTVGINYKIRLCKLDGLTPCLIRLGKEHSLLFWQDRGVEYIPNKPIHKYLLDVFWDSERRCWCYSSRKIPMKFNDPKIIGIVVEGS